VARLVGQDLRDVVVDGGRQPIPGGRAERVHGSVWVQPRPVTGFDDGDVAEPPYAGLVEQARLERSRPLVAVAPTEPTPVLPPGPRVGAERGETRMTRQFILGDDPESHEPTRRDEGDCARWFVRRR